jgi:hypothetical protein
LVQTLKHWHPDASVCLITDADITDPWFDHVRVIARTNLDNPYADDWQVFYQSPFRETIKLEADMWITSSKPRFQPWQGFVASRSWVPKLR